MARNWRDVRAQAVADGHVDETKVAELSETSRRAENAARLADIRKEHRFTQARLAECMHVSQARVSTIERGDIGHAELGTLQSYVEALGGRLTVVAEFGDRAITVTS